MQHAKGWRQHGKAQLHRRPGWRAKVPSTANEAHRSRMCGHGARQSEGKRGPSNAPLPAVLRAHPLGATSANTNLGVGVVGANKDGRGHPVRVGVDAADGAAAAIRRPFFHVQVAGEPDPGTNRHARKLMEIPLCSPGQHRWRQLLVPDHPRFSRRHVFGIELLGISTLRQRCGRRNCR